MNDRQTTVLLTGASGFLGRYVAAELESRSVPCVGTGTADVDLADAAAVGRFLGRAARAERILNCAALSSMAACAADPDRAFAVNARAVEQLATHGARLVQVSTDLVFDGRNAPYRAVAEPEPLGVYGRSKRAGERAALSGGGLVVRLPLLFGRSFDGRRGATDMLRGAVAERRVLRLFTNEFRTPLHAADASAALVDLLLSDRTGVVHVAGPTRVSRFELAERFRAATGCPSGFWEPVECRDDDRPRDVSMTSDVSIATSLDERLAQS